jgi:hypothetical protein
MKIILRPWLKKFLGYLLISLGTGLFGGLISPPFWGGFFAGVILFIVIMIIVQYIKLICWLFFSD